MRFVQNIGMRACLTALVLSFYGSLYGAHFGARFGPKLHRIGQISGRILPIIITAETAIRELIRGGLIDDEDLRDICTPLDPSVETWCRNHLEISSRPVSPKIALWKYPGSAIPLGHMPGIHAILLSSKLIESIQHPEVDPVTCAALPFFLRREMWYLEQQHTKSVYSEPATRLALLAAGVGIAGRMARNARQLPIPRNLNLAWGARSLLKGIARGAVATAIIHIPLSLYKRNRERAADDFACTATQNRDELQAAIEFFYQEEANLITTALPQQLCDRLSPQSIIQLGYLIQPFYDPKHQHPLDRIDHIRERLETQEPEQ